MTKKSAKREPAKKEPPQADALPKQQLGDTVVPPWKMPTPEEKEQAKPVRRALREALDDVDSQEKADAVIEELQAKNAGATATDVAQTQPTPATPTEAAQQVEQAAKQAPPGETAKTVIEETARLLAAAEGREREIIQQATQEVLNPEQQGAAAPAQEEQREYLRRAVLKHLKPFDALDAYLFLRVNHLPHTPLLNRFFYFFTFVFNGGAAWYVLMAALTLFRPRLGWRIVRDSAGPLAIATWLVEFPIKTYFRRRRPFITIIQAIAIGMKPGTWSFPSGHAASAFAGAWLFSRYFRRLNGLWYTVASLVAFSRVYLGDHYPGDVVSGSALGALFAVIFHRVRWPWRPKPPQTNAPQP
jgi:undecaprenyl-diphosphatase